MELIISLILIFTLIYYLTWILNLSRSTSKKNEKLPLPPGSTGWPFIGETLEFLSTAKQSIPEKFISDRKSKYSNNKVFKTSLIGEPMVILCSAEGNKFLFSNENKLVKSWWPNNFKKLFPVSDKTSPDEESIRLRKVLLPFLKQDSLQKYIGIMDIATKKHLETFWDSKTEVQVFPLAKKYVITLACKILLNIEEPEMVAKIEAATHEISGGFISIPINFPGTNFNRAIKASKRVQQEIKKMVVKRKLEILEKKMVSTEDVMSQLLTETYSDGQLLDESDITNVLFALLIGAFDNLTSTITAIMAHLAERPEIYDGVLKEQMEIANSKAQGESLNGRDIQKMKYSRNVAYEVLRLSAPFLGAFRVAISDFTYQGFLIPKGFKLHWNVSSTHTNPEYFHNPKEFDPSRFEGQGPPPFAYIPFGGGPRMCPGKGYAELKILVFMHNVVKSFKWNKVFPNEKLIMDPFLIPTKGLPIRLCPHKP